MNELKTEKTTINLEPETTNSNYDESIITLYKEKKTAPQIANAINLDVTKVRYRIKYLQSKKQIKKRYSQKSKKPENLRKGGFNELLREKEFNINDLNSVNEISIIHKEMLIEFLHGVFIK